MKLRLYTDLAGWWPLLSPPEHYAEEAALYGRLLSGLANREVRQVLELGSGGGHNASHLKQHFSMTLVDIAPAMLEQSRGLNPECEHVEGDMRSVRLGREFDAVFVHDAIEYMTTEADLEAAIRTVAVHLAPGGVAVLVPDETTETFKPRTDHGGEDGPDGRAMRYMEWTHPPKSGESVFRTTFVYALKEADGSVRVESEDHVYGLFPRATWMRLLDESGLNPTAIRHAYGVEDTDERFELFAATRPA